MIQEGHGTNIKQQKLSTNLTQNSKKNQENQTIVWEHPGGTIHSHFGTIHSHLVPLEHVCSFLTR